MAGKQKKKNAEQYIKPVNKSDISGIMILALGVSAVLGVGIYATLKHFKNQEIQSGEINMQDGIEQAIVRDKQVLAQKLPKNSQDMTHPDFNEIKGSWKLSFGTSGVAVIFIADNFFQLTVTTDSKGAVRQYSRGKVSYQLDTGKLSLIPTNDVGKPDSVKGVTYQIFTMRPYDVFVSREKNDPLLYFIAPQSDVAGKTFHPLFLYADYAGAPVLKWQRIE